LLRARRKAHLISSGPTDAARPRKRDIPCQKGRAVRLQCASRRGRERSLGEPGERIDRDHGLVRARQNRDRWPSKAPLQPIGLRSAGRASGNTVHRPFSWKEGASATSALQVNDNCHLAFPCAKRIQSTQFTAAATSRRRVYRTLVSLGVQRNACVRS
jgi:hypothetical protein